jgi:hypothetical protein
MHLLLIDMAVAGPALPTLRYLQEMKLQVRKVVLHSYISVRVETVCTFKVVIATHYLRADYTLGADCP